jgi:hypothetical protein
MERPCASGPGRSIRISVVSASTVFISGVERAAHVQRGKGADDQQTDE